MCSLAVSTFSSALAASSCVDGLWREGGGCFSWRFFGPRVRWRGGVVCVLRSRSPSLVYLPSWRLRVRARIPAPSPYLSCVCMRVWCGHTILALFTPSGLWFARLMVVVCSPVACGSLSRVSLGCPSHHHFSPLGLPIRYSLIPSLFRSAVLAASCSSCVLRRCQYFFPRWRSCGDCGDCVWAYFLLFLCPWVCGICVLWRWCALRWRVVPSFRLRAGVPHTMLLSSVRTT